MSNVASMTAAKCLSFLSANQPLPADADLSADIVNELDTVRLWLCDHPVPEALPLLLRVFGDGDGLGVYPLIEDTVARFPRDAVVAELAAVLEGSPDATRYWALQLASTFPSKSMVRPMCDLLPVLDHDSRLAALTALEAIGGDEARRCLSEWAQKEIDPELRALISDIMAG